jgi:transcriptional regulator with XRE-family HTH domain
MREEIIVDIMQPMYNGEFTIEQRKIMTAQVLQELRKSLKLSQKEVAGKLGIPPTTYNTYESGRTEPPIEILVRLSHLYGIPVDMIVQRDRIYGTAEDLSRRIAAFKEEMAELDKKVAEGAVSDPGVMALLSSLDKLADAMTAFSQTEGAKQAINKSFPGNAGNTENP